jgi:hypothetical protein
MTKQELGNQKEKMHRRDACATKDISINAVREIKAYATFMG